MTISTSVLVINIHRLTTRLPQFLKRLWNFHGTSRLWMETIQLLSKKKPQNCLRARMIIQIRMMRIKAMAKEEASQNINRHWRLPISFSIVMKKSPNLFSLCFPHHFSWNQIEGSFIYVHERLNIFVNKIECSMNALAFASLFELFANVKKLFTSSPVSFSFSSLPRRHSPW